MSVNNIADTKIRLLPEHLINQIKAGEVVERPSSIIKELLENSLDAGSEKINIHIREHGMKLISVDDNGIGMQLEQLPLAFCRHATSKINRFEDIYSLSNFGFRGEALASIASVSRITCTSSPRNTEGEGGKIVIHGGKEVTHVPYHGNECGTSIYVEDLFYNTPARLKFVKSTISERNAISKIINAFVMTCPEIHFSVKWDEREKIIYTATSKNKIKDRITEVIFNNRSKTRKLLEIEGVYENYSLKGYASFDSSKGGSGKHHYLFVNRRMFFDKKLHYIILKSLENFWPHQETGHYVLYLSAPPGEIDVNVHPGKIQIRFLKQGLVYSLFSQSIKSVLNKHPALEKPSCPESLPLSTEKNHVPLINDVEKTTTGYSKYKRLLPGHFMIDSGLNNYYLVSVKRLFTKYLGEKLTSPFPRPDNQIIPLLVGEVFEGYGKNLSQHIPNLRKLGFDLDEMKSGNLILRSIPDCFYNLEIKSILKTLLDFLEQKNQDEFLSTVKNWSQEGIISDFSSIHTQQLENIVNTFDFETLLSDRIIIKIDEDTLSNLF